MSGAEPPQPAYPQAVPRYAERLARELFAPLIEGRPEGASWEVLSWDSEQGLCLTLRHQGAVLLLELEARDEGADCWARTARFNVHVRRLFEHGRPLSDRDRWLVERVVEVIRRREPLLPIVERPGSSARMVVREVLAEQLLIPEGQGQYYINPYVGCVIGCDFCYVAERADFSRSLEGLPAQPWGRYVDVKVNAAELLATELTRHPPGAVRFSPILTDPYQGPERHYRITRRCLELLLPAGFSPVILTRARRVLDDLDLLRRFERAAVGLSIPTDDDRLRALFEPGADPIEERFEALEALHAAGIPTFAVIQPMLPMNTARMVERLAPVVKSVRVDRMHFLDRVRPIYEANGLAHAMTDEFFEETRKALLDPLRERGIEVDAMDDLAGLVRGGAAG